MIGTQIDNDRATEAVREAIEMTARLAVAKTMELGLHAPAMAIGCLPLRRIVIAMVGGHVSNSPLGPEPISGHRN